jgi:hypothetical protein
MPTIALKAGLRMVPVEITEENGKLWLEFAYNPDLVAEVRSFEGARWWGKEEEHPRKAWSVKDSPRNRFQLAYLEHPGADDPENPYAIYDNLLVEHATERPLYTHQKLFVREWLTYRRYILAAEMRTGKTLAAIEGMEASGFESWWWVGPKSALVSVKDEFELWRAKVVPQFFTYEGFKKELLTWTKGTPPPRGVVFDEASRLKTPTVARSVAARHLSEAIAREYGRDGYVLLMTGTPAPKDPADWWHLCEVAQAGFIREGSYHKFRERLAVMERNEKLDGTSYQTVFTWRDAAEKCKQCGNKKDHSAHQYHPFAAGVDEVSLLYERMKGLVRVALKKDCLDLPDKVFKVVELKPSDAILNAAELIKAAAASAATALILMRELSDGFQYAEVPAGEESCTDCDGCGKILEPVDWSATRRDLERGTKEDGSPLDTTCVAVDCYRCNGTGKAILSKREAKRVPCPKDAYLVEQLDLHEDDGRLVICAGFQGSIDRYCELVAKQQWDFLRIDGRGWFSNIAADEQELYRIFRRDKDKSPRLCIVMHPASGGMGLNLAASRTMIFASNDFNAESRLQCVERIHSPDMDTNKGATIIDLVHLPSDRLVLKNLAEKKRLMSLTMGELIEGTKVA